jgi:hypothetical protein
MNTLSLETNWPHYHLVVRVEIGYRQIVYWFGLVGLWLLAFALFPLLLPIWLYLTHKSKILTQELDAMNPVVSERNYHEMLGIYRQLSGLSLDVATAKEMQLHAFFASFGRLVMALICLRNRLGEQLYPFQPQATLEQTSLHFKRTQEMSEFWDEDDDEADFLYFKEHNREI